MKVIAECGVNFDTVDQAFDMIEKSMDAGCAYTKFQLYDDSVIKDSPLQAELRKRMITREFAEKLFDAGKDIGQPVIFTPMFLDAIDWIADMKVPMIKIRLADQANVEIGTRAQATGIPILSSIPAAYINDYLTMHPETTRSYNDEQQQIRFLYCVGSYPAHPDTYRFIPSDFIGSKRPGSHIIAGVSDHTKGPEVMARALECGAAFCEVHVMLEGTHPIEEKWSKTFEEVRTFQQS
ncbi:N-acetylneuraminate synthase family protein [candidate division WOR-3 bacterium]|nr:N-acetylneuraminate synthase family protein [candidate division WOR-3 bacterium]